MATHEFTLRTDVDSAKDGKEYQKLLDRRLTEIRNQPDSPVHENLLNFRSRQKLKKQEMADFMGITSRTYYAYEKGLRPIPSDALVRLAIMTGVDLNEILMGRPVRTEFQVIRSGLQDLSLILKLLETEYPDLDSKMHFKIAHYTVTTDWQDMPRMHPEAIRRSVLRFTRYRDHPEDLPAPPLFDDYKDNQHQYEQDMTAWQAMVDDNFVEEDQK